MKKNLLGVMTLLLFSITSCSDIDLPISNTESKSTLLNPQNIENKGYNILYFDNKASFDAVLSELSNLTSNEEKENLIKKSYPNFHSIQNLYWEAMEEMALINGDSKEDIISFQKKYEKLYFPSYMDDAGFYIPISNLDAAYLANEDCKVSIADEIIDLRDISEYNQLVNLGRAMYSNTGMPTRGTMGTFYLNSTSMNSVGPEYDSDWMEYNGKKIKLKARRRFETYSPSPTITGSRSLFHLEFCFRKKTWLGWSNYKSRSTINFDANIPGYGTITKMFENNGNSSHDDEFEYPIRITSDTSNTYYIFDEAPCHANVLFMDFGKEVDYNWNMAGIQCVTPRTENPFFIIPRL